MENVTELGIEVTEKEIDDRPARILEVGGVAQSAVFLEEEYRFEPVLIYAKKVLSVIKENFKKTQARVLMLGGGGFEIARSFLHYFPDASMDVVEYSPEIIDYAKEGFFLDELKADGRLRVYVEDAFSFLGQSEEKYDMIINDVFVSYVPPLNALTDGTVEHVKSHLAEDGLYLLNLISALEGAASMPLQLELRILMRFFESVKAYPCMAQESPLELHNIIMACHS